MEGTEPRLTTEALHLCNEGLVAGLEHAMDPKQPLPKQERLLVESDDCWYEHFMRDGVLLRTDDPNVAYEQQERDEFFPVLDSLADNLSAKT